MGKIGSRLLWLLVVILEAIPGCSGKPANVTPRAGHTAEEAETAVRQQFADIQAALKARDMDKVWSLLSSKSRAAAEEEAQAIRTDYEKAGPPERAAQEKKLGLSGQDLAKLTGTGFLKTALFLRKYDEVAESTVERLTVGGDSVTVYFKEPDGDREKLAFLQEAGQWKAWLAMPKARKP